MGTSTYRARQDGVTALLPLGVTVDSATCTISAFESLETDSVHFMSIALVRLKPSKGDATHLLIEANFDGSLKEYCDAWYQAAPDMVEQVLGLIKVDCIDNKASVTRQLRKALSTHDYGTGAYYKAVDGVSVRAIRANARLFKAVGNTIRQMPDPSGDAPSQIFKTLRSQHQVGDNTRSYRVRFGSFVAALVRKYFLFLFVAACWAATGLLRDDASGFTTHLRDAVMLFTLLALVVGVLNYLDHYLSRTRSGIFHREGGQTWMVLVRFILLVAVCLGVLWMIGAFNSNTPWFLLVLLCLYLIWPGAALLSIFCRDPFTLPETVLKKTVGWSLLGIAILLFAHHQYAAVEVVDRATTLIVSILAIAITIASVLLELRIQDKASDIDYTWFVAPLLLLPTIIVGKHLIGYLAVFIVIPVLALHWVAREFGKVRALERSQKARIPPSAQHLTEIAEFEDLPDKHQNHLISVTHVHPDRVAALKLVMGTTTIALYLSGHSGTLMGIPTIHFARWVVVHHEGHHFLLFLSNYGGAFDSYLDEFIDNAAPELNLIWGPTIGYPRTRWMVGGGANRREEFKRYARSSQVPTLYHYSAYPHLSVNEIEEQIRLRTALASEASEGEEAELLRLFQR